MNVGDILEEAIELSVGSDSVDDDEKALYLKYLNSACSELYRKTALLDDRRAVVSIFPSFDESGDLLLKDKNGEDASVLGFQKVRSKKVDFFQQISWDKMQELKFLEDNANPVFCARNHILTLHSSESSPYDVFVSYVPSFVNLKEDTKEADIPFRKEWHPLLVYGTLYYIYQDIDGYKSSVKESEAASEWKKGISECSSWLFNIYSDEYRPYTRV